MRIPLGVLIICILWVLFGAALVIGWGVIW